MGLCDSLRAAIGAARGFASLVPLAQVLRVSHQLFVGGTKAAIQKVLAGTCE